MTDWIQCIATLQNSGPEFNYVLPKPPSDGLLRDAKTILGLTEPPADLWELYQFCNGIQENFRGEMIGYLVWPVEHLIARNLDIRTHSSFKDLYQDLGQLLFFADGGNGDLFGYACPQGRVDDAAIFCWDHVDDRRNCIAADLQQFLVGWAAGDIVI